MLTMQEGTPMKKEYINYDRLHIILLYLLNIGFLIFFMSITEKVTIQEEISIKSSTILSFPYNYDVKCQEGVSVNNYRFVGIKGDTNVYGCLTLTENNTCAGNNKLCIVTHQKRQFR